MEEGTRELWANTSIYFCGSRGLYGLGINWPPLFSGLFLQSQSCQTLSMVEETEA